MSSRAAGLGVGLVFGVVLVWSGMASPDVLRAAFLFESSYVFLCFGSAVLVAAIGIRFLRRFKVRALLTRVLVHWDTERPTFTRLAGAVLFGIGWGVADACPGPIAAQVGDGIASGLCTFVGVIIGVYLFQRRNQPEPEPAIDATCAYPELAATD